MNAPAQGGMPVPVVLVVEDNAAHLLQLQKLFRLQGMNVVTAVDGISGLQCAYQYLPDLIVANSEMPHLNGFCLARLLKIDAATAAIPVIVLREHADRPLPAWYEYAGVDQLVGTFEDPVALPRLAWDVIRERGFPGARARARPADGAPSTGHLDSVLEMLLVHHLMSTAISALAPLITVGNRHQVARAMFDVLAAVLGYRAAGVFLLQPDYATFFLHTPQTLPSDLINGLLAHAVVPLRSVLRGAIRLELFSGTEETPRELGRWTPMLSAVPPNLPILTESLHLAEQPLGCIAVIPPPSGIPRGQDLLHAFAEQFSPILAGLYLYEGRMLLQRAADNPSETATHSAATSSCGTKNGGAGTQPVPLSNDAPDRFSTYTPTFQPVDLRVLVRDVCGAVGPDMQRRRLRFEARIPSVVPTLQLDPDGIATALSYLLHHAMSHTIAGDSVTLWVIVDEEQVRIAVQDTGDSINAAGQRELFRDTGASGPAASRKIVEAHGGAMSLESTPGKGSLLVLTLPIPGRGATSHPTTREGAA